MDINVFTDQATRHRVGVGTDADRASLSDSNPLAMPGVDALRGEIAQLRPFLGESLSPPTVALNAKFPEELLVAGTSTELAAAAEHQRLIDGGLESVMALLDISILVGLPGRDGLGFQAVVSQQAAIPLSEEFFIAMIVWN